MEPDWVPRNAILTPNKKEFEKLFGCKVRSTKCELRSKSGKAKDRETCCETDYLTKKHQCIIALKGPEMIVCSAKECVLVKGGNAGLTKGGTGDVLAGLTVALAAQNPPFLAAAAASFIVKKAAGELYQKVGFAYSSDDLADKIPEVLGEYWRQG